MTITRRLTVDDLDALNLPMDDGNRYELIDGVLHVSTQPHLLHQMTSLNLGYALTSWSRKTRLGITAPAPGVVFTKHDAVAPDIVWVAADRVQEVVGDDGKLHAAPDIAIEILSPGRANEERDRELKLGVYSRYGGKEYWLANWRDQTI